MLQEKRRDNPRFRALSRLRLKAYRSIRLLRVSASGGCCHRIELADGAILFSFRE